MTLGDCVPAAGQTWPSHVGPSATTSAPFWASSTRPMGTLPMVVLTWTWCEAIEVANRVAEGRASVRKQGDRWAVRWYARPVLMN